jgi:hypothetical protein
MGDKNAANFSVNCVFNQRSTHEPSHWINQTTTDSLESKDKITSTNYPP